MASSNEQPFFNCGGADRLCLQTRNVSTGVPIPIFWPKGQFPLSVQASNLRLRLYQGDLAKNPQDNPCSVGQSTLLLQSWDGLTSTNSPYSNMESALVTIASGNSGIESAIGSGSTSVFMQLTDPTNAI